MVEPLPFSTWPRPIPVVVVPERASCHNQWRRSCTRCHCRQFLRFGSSTCIANHQAQSRSIVGQGFSSKQVDCGDEDTFDGSELSNVSEPKVSKNTAASSIKPVPYRQSKVTMLLQPHFTNSAQWNLDRKKTTTCVTTIMTAYPGHRDYAEKRSLLNDLELLLGSDIAKRMKHTVNTGLDTPKHVESKATSLDDTSEETSSLEMSDDDDGGMVLQQRVARPVASSRSMCTKLCGR